MLLVASKIWLKHGELILQGEIVYIVYISLIYLIYFGGERKLIHGRRLRKVNVEIIESCVAENSRCKFVVS